ncbi:amino acid transporter [Martensiomyces pterosporus]|nr:amino acid transporter [Martensiomyces pterosporus]
MSLMVWCIGGIVSACGCIAYMELGTMLPRSGGEKEYLDVSFQRPKALMPFIFCMTSIFIGGPSSSAADAVVTGTYFLYAAGDTASTGDGKTGAHTEWAQRAIAVAVVVFCTLAHGCFVKSAIRLQSALTVLKVLMLLLIVLVGFVGIAGRLHGSKPHSFTNAFQGTSTNPNSYSSALFKVFFAYAGYNSLNYSIDELKNPIHNLPRAALGGLFVTSALYILSNVAYFSVLTPEAIGGSSTAVAGVFFTAAFNETWGQRIVPVFIGLSSFGTVMCGTFSSSRVIFEAAREGYLPFGSYIGEISRYQSPLYALWLNCLMTVVFIVAPPPGGAYNFLIDIGGYPSWVFYGLSVVGLLLMRRTHRELARPFKSWHVANAVTIGTAVYMCIVPFIKPKSDDSSIPYWAAPLSGIISILMSCVLWYLQIVQRRGLETSHYAKYGYPREQFV